MAESAAKIQQRIIFTAQHQDRSRSLKKEEEEFTPGVDSLKRCVLASSASPAQWADCRCLLEAIFVRLCRIHRSPKKQGRELLSRWSLILRDNENIWHLILANGATMQATNLQLVQVNQTPLTQWHNKRVKRDLALVLQGVQLLLHCLWPLGLFHLQMSALLWLLNPWAFSMHITCHRAQLGKPSGREQPKLRSPLPHLLSKNVKCKNMTFQDQDRKRSRRTMFAANSYR